MSKDSPEPIRRNETEHERADRRFGDLLQELRVMQTGAQLTAGFLLTLPFQPSFSELDAFQETLYLALVLLAAMTTALVLGPVAVHRKLTGRYVKERVVSIAHRLAMGALVTLGLLVTGIVLLIFDVVLGRGTAFAFAGGTALILLSLLAALPLRLTADR